MEKIKDNLLKLSKLKINDIYLKLNSSKDGLSDDNINQSIDLYGKNIVTKTKKKSFLKRLIETFINPFTLILIFLAILSIFTDVVFTQNKDYTAVIIILAMVLISGILKYFQEIKSGDAALKLIEMVENTTLVIRKREKPKEIPMNEIVVGDIISLSAGDMIPADSIIIESKDLFISQSSLTGESVSIEKRNIKYDGNDIFEASNIAFMGTSVISGSAKIIVVGVGDNTVFGNIASNLNKEVVITSFEKGVDSISLLLIKYMLYMLPVVFIINGVTKGNWLQALLFAISIAVGLTPEMLPMIVTTSLSKGAMFMAKEKVIIKNLNSIQKIGAINILCTDKTGTLTEDKIVLQYHLNTKGEEDLRVLRYSFLNSNYQTGLKNLMDLAIINKTYELKESDKEFDEVINKYVKVDEIPFDFERRRMSVVVKKDNDKTVLITKGAVEEILSISKYIEYNNKTIALDEKTTEMIKENVRSLNEKGMRVIAVAKKTNPAPIDMFSVKDESDMTLIGYLAFLDPPKSSSIAAIKALKNSGIDIKVITGDNEEVTKAVCNQLNIKFNKIYTGIDIEKLSDVKLTKIVNKETVFCKMSPDQKTRIIKLLKESGNSVGYLGDGINDAGALEIADVGISVDNAVDIAKESANVILLEKDLMVLENGILEGRKTYMNMIKYIKLTASSNFGNVFSVLIASAFLPFLPMAAIQLLILNLIYDISCTAIPWDNVDKESLTKPKDWDASSVSKFMIWFGPISSIFDILTFGVLYYLVCPIFTGGVLFHQLVNINSKLLFIAAFQTGWFIESMMSQTIVIHLIRTNKIPFIESRASTPLILLTLTATIFLTLIPYTIFAKSLSLIPMPAIYFVYLLIILVGYIFFVLVIKKFYINKYGELL